MVIVFVIDNFFARENGTIITAQRFYEALKRKGHEVRVVSIGVSGEGMFGVAERHIPFVSKVSQKQSISFAKADVAVMRQAFEGASVIHFFMPWKLQRVGRKLAARMGIPVTAAFHVQPENITYNLGLKRLGFVASYIYGKFLRTFYKYFDNIHCPSVFIARELKRHKYKSKLHVISNGISSKFTPGESLPRNIQKDGAIFNILMIGRLAAEKRQDLLIRAVNISKYKDKIQLYFAGRGPKEAALKKMAAKLPNMPVFGFYSEDELVALIRKSDLYVHPSDIEIEAISCLEAFSCGRVPVISDSKKSATPQFALDSRSLFKAGDAADLAHKIDYWIEHPNERTESEARYAEQGRWYSLEHSVKKAEEMFEQAIVDHKAKILSKTDKRVKRMRNRIRRRSMIREALERMFYFGIVFPIIYVINVVFFGLRIKNRKYLRKLRGAITISNHVHTLDSTMVAITCFPKKPIFTTLPSNFKIPVAGQLVNYLGGVPIPLNQSETKVFFYELSKRVCAGKMIHFFPEGELIKYCTKLRDFKRGAFYLANIAKVPVVPMRITFREPTGLYKLYKRKPLMTITVGAPIYPDEKLLKNDALKVLHDKACDTMAELEIKASA